MADQFWTDVLCPFAKYVWSIITTSSAWVEIRSELDHSGTDGPAERQHSAVRPRAYSPSKQLMLASNYLIHRSAALVPLIQQVVGPSALEGWSTAAVLPWA